MKKDVEIFLRGLTFVLIFIVLASFAVAQTIDPITEKDLRQTAKRNRDLINSLNNNFQAITGTTATANAKITSLQSGVLGLTNSVTTLNTYTSRVVTLESYTGAVINLQTWTNIWLSTTVAYSITNESTLSTNVLNYNASGRLVSYIVDP